MLSERDEFSNLFYEEFVDKVYIYANKCIHAHLLNHIYLYAYTYIHLYSL